MENSLLPIYVIIGTRAQFIKVAPVLRLMRDQKMQYTLIYTAQHRENIEEILAIYHLPPPDSVLYDREEANTKSSFTRWFFAVVWKALFQARRYLPRPGIVLTHGDTFTAWLAALMGRRAGCQVGHVESGCRSYHLFSPFPEEISRLLTFALSNIYFCADEWAVNNLQRYRGIKVNMGANTILDGVRYALHVPEQEQLPYAPGKYAVVSVHRFENIFTSRFTETILPLLKEIASRNCPLILTLHPTTRERLRALGLYEALQAHPNIILHERFGFVEWIHVCNRAAFVITDGGSNQEELSYLGVPTLLFRNETERREGLGANVVLSRFDRRIIDAFLENPERYRTTPVLSEAQPSQTILQTIRELFRTGQQQ